MSPPNGTGTATQDSGDQAAKTGISMPKPTGQEATSDEKSSNQNASPSGQRSADQKSSATKAKSQATKAKGDGNGAIAALKADHRKVEQLFARYEKAKDGEKRSIIEEVCKSLVLHTMLEEEIFYPACRAKLGDEDPLDEAQVEHDSAKLLIADLMMARETDPFRDAKVKVLAEQIRHHVAEEEEPKSGIFAKAAVKGVDSQDLASDLEQRRAQLEREDRLPAGEPVSIRPQAQRDQNSQRNYNREEYQDMASYQQRGMERDDQGRFSSGNGGRGGRGHDDDDRGRSSRGRERDEDGRFMSSRDDDRGRSRYDNDDDRGDRSGRSGSARSGRDSDDGRGWHGDSRGHSEAARRGWDDRGSSRSSSSRYDDDDRSRSSRSGQNRGRDDDDDRSGNGSRGGWFGDSRGHSEAARRGWDNPDHGDSGWYGDSRGHSEAARRGWDNPDHGRSGWYGDSEGHSEAARRGWDDRGSSRSSRGGRDEDDDRGGRSRSSSSSYSSRRDDDDDRGGQGGWFGDSRGHSEAARKGWESRH